MKTSVFNYCLLLFAGILMAEMASAQFSLTGEYRPRTEYSHGYGTLAADNQDASTFTSQRTRLNFSFTNEFIRTGLVLQDVRTWGNQAQLVMNQDFAVSLHQGWAEVLFSPKFSLKAGRQELSYDDQRIFGPVGWLQQARSHDLALFKYEGDVKLHFGIAHNENTDRRNNLYNGPDAYKDMQFVWFNKSWEKESMSLLLLNNGVPVMVDGKQENRYSQTIGGRVTLNPKPVSIASNLYFQTGKDLTNRDISAYNFLLEVSAKMNPTAAATFGVELLSGTPTGETDKLKSFNPLYGTNHKFNGFMDYFYVAGQHINNVGLNDFYFKWACSRFKNVQWNLDLHYFGANAKLPGDAKSYLGTEIDFDLTYTVNSFTKITFGYSHLLPGASMKLVKTGGSTDVTQNWAYLMLSVTPKFL
ncbi:MAG: hypothetical protein ACOZDD_10050 [Bacteroidota bacterium]